MGLNKSQLPRNLEVEKAILGAILADSSTVNDVVDVVTPEAFFDQKHQLIYSAIYSLARKNEKIDFQTVMQELKTHSQLNAVGGVDYLYELTQSTYTHSHIDQYVDILKQTANLRELLLCFNEIEQEYLTGKIDNYTQFVGTAQKRLNEIADKRKISNFLSSKEVVEALDKRLREIKEKNLRQEFTGLDTGFNRFNKYINGLEKQTLMVIAGRPGVGKTAFGLQLALNLARHNHDEVSIAIFEMEMAATTLYSRLVANLSCVDNYRIKTASYNERDKLKIDDALNQLSKLNLYIDESNSLTILELATKARKLKAERPDLGVIVVDYLGLIQSGKNRRYESRSLEIAEYTRTLHELARELDIAVILIAQLNRKVEERTEGGLPKLSDLRESGAIEADAEIVILLHRSDYGKTVLHEQFAKEKVKAANMSDDARRALVARAEQRTIEENNKGKTNVNKENSETKSGNSSLVNAIIAKNRNGVGESVVQFIFEKQYSRFQETSNEFENQKAKLDSKYSEE